MSILRTKIVVDSTGAKAGYRQASLAARKYSNVSKRAARSAGKVMRAETTKTANHMAHGMSKMKMVTMMAFMAIAMGIVKIFAVAFRGFRDFNREMTRSLAIMTDVTTKQRAMMTGLAKSLSKDLNIAPELMAKGYFFLASAGLNAAQSIAAIPEVAKFAKAGAFDLALATDLATDALSALGLKSQNAQENLQNLVFVQDRLVKANTLANATVQQFSESLTNRAGVAMRQLNISLESGLSLLSVWADQGIKGRIAGTRFEIMTRELTRSAINNADAFERMNIKVFEQDGSLRSLSGIVKSLTDSMGDMSVKQKIVALSTLGFTFRSISAIKSVLGQSEAMRRYEKELKKAAGTTDKVTREQMKAFDERIGGLTKTFGLWMQQGIRPAIIALADLADWIKRVSRDARGLGASIIETNTELDRLSKADAAIQTLEDLFDKTRKTTEQQEAFGDAIAFLAAEFPNYITHFNDAGEAVGLYTDALSKNIERQRELQLRLRAQDTSKLIGGLSDDRRKLANTVSEQKFRADGGERPVHRFSSKITFDSLAQSAAEYRLKIDQAEQAMHNLFITFKGDEDKITEFFKLGGVELKKIPALVEEVVAVMGKGFSVSAPSGTGIPDEELVRLVDKYNTLKEEQKRIVEDGEDPANRLVEINRTLYKMEQQRDALLKKGVESVKREAEETKKLVEQRAELLRLAAENPQTMMDIQGIQNQIFTMFGISFSQDGFTRDNRPDIQAPDQLRTMSRAEQDATDAARKELERWMKNLLQSTDKSLSKTVRNVAVAGRAVLTLVDNFGNLSDSLRKAATGALDVIDNVSRLDKLGSGAGLLDKVIPYIGIAAGAIGVLGGLAGAGIDQEALAKSIRENTRRIEDAIFEVVDAVRAGSDISQQDAQLAFSAFSAFIGSGSLDTFGGSASQGYFNNLIAAMRQGGFNVDGLSDQFASLKDALELGRIRESAGLGNELTLAAEEAIRNFFAQIASQIVPLLTGPGQFSGSTVEGILGRSGFLESMAGAGSPELFNTLLSSLQDLDGIGPMMEEFLSSLAGLDPTTKAGQDQIKAIVEGFARSIDEGGVTGSLTPAEIDSIMQRLLGLASGSITGDGGIELSDKIDIVAQVQRTVTVFQANEMIVLDEERNWLLRQGNAISASIAVALGASLPSGTPPANTDPLDPPGPPQPELPREPTSASNASIAVTINTQPVLNQDIIDELKFVLEEEIRKRVMVT